MESRNMECAIELIWEQYQDMTDRDDKWEMAYLEDEAEKGVDEFGTACRILFGVKLDWALYHAIAHAHELNEHAYSIFDVWRDEESKIAAILMARDLAGAAKLIHRIQRKHKCGLVAQSHSLTRSTGYYAKGIQKKIDPDGTLCPEAVDPVVNPNLRDAARDEFIYHARKVDKRTYSDIGKELGISLNRVAQIYHKVDYERNGINADHHQADYQHRDIIVDGERIHTQKKRVIPFPTIHPQKPIPPK